MNYIKGYISRWTAYSLHYVRYAVHGFAHCGFCPFVCPDSWPKYPASAGLREHPVRLPPSVEIIKRI